MQPPTSIEAAAAGAYFPGQGGLGYQPQNPAEVFLLVLAEKVAVQGAAAVRLQVAQPQIVDLQRAVPGVQATPLAVRPRRQLFLTVLHQAAVVGGVRLAVSLAPVRLFPVSYSVVRVAKQLI